MTRAAHRILDRARANAWRRVGITGTWTTPRSEPAAPASDDETTGKNVAGPAADDSGTGRTADRTNGATDDK